MLGGLGLGSQARPCLRLVLFIFLLAFLSIFYFFNDVTSVGYFELIRRTNDFDADFFYNNGPSTCKWNVSSSTYNLWEPVSLKIDEK